MAQLDTGGTSRLERSTQNEAVEVPLSELYLIDGRPSNDVLLNEAPGTIHEPDVSDWGIGGLGAQIMNISTFQNIRDAYAGHYIVMISGGNDPAHPGHFSNMIEAKRIADEMAEERGKPDGGLVVMIVNGNRFLWAKKEPKDDVPFTTLRERCEASSAVLGSGHIVIPFDISGDQTVSVALERIRPDMFAKGGDRKPDGDPPPETPVCERLGIEVQYNVGIDKIYSSSWAQQGYVERFLRNLERSQGEVAQAAEALLNAMKPNTH